MHTLMTLILIHAIIMLYYIIARLDRQGHGGVQVPHGLVHLAGANGYLSLHVCVYTYIYICICIHMYTCICM